MNKKIIDNFTSEYFNSMVWNGKTFWMGVKTQKNPLDLWFYQELIYRIKPDCIIEAGTADGGSALFIANICDIIDYGYVITIDINKISKIKHKRIEFLTGSSVSDEIINKLKEKALNFNKVMVILDSDHHTEHVLKEIRLYSKFVSVGSYLIVEDTVINNPLRIDDYNSGPMEAVKEFLKNNDNFAVEPESNKFLLTFNPNGVLKRLR